MDLHVTQIIDVTKGVHGLLPKWLRLAPPCRGISLHELGATRRGTCVAATSILAVSRALARWLAEPSPPELNCILDAFTLA
jgi:hypothetical protein